jgi:hypothetical protein
MHALTEQKRFDHAVMATAILGSIFRPLSGRKNG